MNILDRLIKHRKPVQTIIWGIRVPKNIKEQWQLLAAIMRIPANRLVMYVLADWVRQNEGVLRDNQAREQLGERINRSYLLKI